VVCAPTPPLPIEVAIGYTPTMPFDAIVFLADIYGRRKKFGQIATGGKNIQNFRSVPVQGGNCGEKVWNAWEKFAANIYPVGTTR
jgi:hypothetical protein